MSKRKRNQEGTEGGSKYKYIRTMIEVRDRVHEQLINKCPEYFQRMMMSQNEHLVKHLKQGSACCIKELDLITPELLSSLAATRYRLLTSISEYELINMIARVICEMEVDETWVADILFETCMYFYTQKKLMKMLRLSSLEQRIRAHNNHQKRLEWIHQQRELVFTTNDKEDMLFYNQLVG